MQPASEWVGQYIRRIRESRPSITIGSKPTYTRWYVIPRNRWFNIYLHNFINDDDHHLHDHRMLNISILLEGSYFEDRFQSRPVVDRRLPNLAKRRLVREGHCVVRLPWTPHRVVLCRDEEDHPKPTWSLFIGFLHCRNWGFWIAGRDRIAIWVPHEDYVADSDPLSPGYGQLKMDLGA